MTTRLVFISLFTVLFSLAGLPQAVAQTPRGVLFSPDNPCHLAQGQTKCTVTIRSHKSDTPWACIWVPGDFKVFRCFSGSNDRADWPHANDQCCLLSLRAHQVNPFTDPRWDGAGNPGAQAIFNEATELATLQVSGSPSAGDRFFNPFPKTGTWTTAGEGSARFVIEIQNGVLRGVYFGADQNGDDVWLSFGGELFPSFFEQTEFQFGWTLDSPLIRTTGGGCILDCLPGNPAPAAETEEVGRIVFDFLERSKATFRIDGGEAIAIAPQTWGVEAPAFDPNQPLEQLPDLAGTWVAAELDGGPSISDGIAGVVAIGERRVTEIESGQEPGTRFLEVSFPAALTRTDTGLPFPETFEFTCRFQLGENSAGLPTSCFLSPLLFNPFTIQFYSITDHRFTVTVVLGTDPPGPEKRFDFFRLNYN